MATELNQSHCYHSCKKTYMMRQPKLSTGITWHPSKLNLFLTWPDQNNTMLGEFNQLPGSTNPTHKHIYEWLRPAQKLNPMHDPHLTHTHKNKEPEMII